MFDPPSSVLVAGLHSVVVACLVALVGLLLVDAVLGERDLSFVARAGLAVPGVLAAATVLMLLHVASGGRLYASPTAVRVLTAAALVSLLALSVLRRVRQRRDRNEEPEEDDERASGPRDLAGVVALAVVLLAACAIWGRSVLELVPVGIRGDMKFHTGFAAQLTNGEALPSNAITGDIPNGYPWLFHSLLAWIAGLVPGERPVFALGAVQLLEVTGAASALFTLGHAAWRHWAAGVTTAVLGSMSGGFAVVAWLVFGRSEPQLVFDVRGGDNEIGEMLGDLMARRPYNVSLHYLAPAFPRELTYAIVPAVLLLVLVGLRTRRARYMVAAGVTVGLLGLTGGEAMFAAGATLALLVLVGGREFGRLRMALALGLPFALTYALWAAPMLVNYLRYDGFYDLSAPPVVLTPLEILGGWGIVTPLALLGAALLVVRARAEIAPRVVLAYVLVMCLIVPATALAASVATSGLETLSRGHRYWPLFFQALALCAGFGLFWLFGQARRLHVTAAVALLALATAVAVSSPVLAPSLLRDQEPPSPEFRRAMLGDEDAWLNVLSPVPGERCVVAVEKQLTREAFAYTGYRMVWYVWTRVHANSARVRWRGIYEEIVPDAERREDNTVLVEAAGARGRFDAAAAKYSVDRVAVVEEALESPILAGRPVESGLRRGERVGVVELDTCE